MIQCEVEVTVKKTKKAQKSTKRRCWVKSCNKVLTKKEMADYGDICTRCYWDSRVQH